VAPEPRTEHPDPDARRPQQSSGPSLRVEKRLVRGGSCRVAGMDEVGRGSPAGPAFVGVVVVDASVARVPPGVRDSKLLSPSRREALVPAIQSWAADWGVGEASASEVDRFGVNGALRLAGWRALGQLLSPPDLVLLDGGHDWLTPPPTIEESEPVVGPASPGPSPEQPVARPSVVTRVRADRACASVAAASILAKVARDAVMVELAGAHPDYGWEENKGYGTSAHFDALRRLGPTPHHRLSWRLPVTDGGA